MFLNTIWEQETSNFKINLPPIRLSLIFKTKNINHMKKVLLVAIVALGAYSCTPKNENKANATDANQFGFNYDSSANIDAIRATFKDMENYDTASYVKKYADSAIFHDNLKVTTLAENVAMQAQFIAAGLKVKVNPDNAVWGSRFNFKDGTVGDYVYSYITVKFTKGDKSIDVVNFQADKFNKDGKIVEEFIVYDQSGIAQLLK